MEDALISELGYVGSTGYTLNDLLVLVNYDIPEGTTKNTKITDLKNYVLSTVSADTNTFITGFTYNNNKFTLYDNSGNTFSATINNVSGLTVNGDLIVTGNTSLPGLTATTISATTYQNLPIDVRLTGGTFNNNTDTISFTNNTGGTFTVTGITDYYVTGGTFNTNNDTITLTRNDGNTVSITGITDWYTTGFTYSNNIFSIKDNSGNTFNTTINTMSGLTINGNLNVNGTTTLSGTTNQIGDFNVTGNTSQSGNTIQVGNLNVNGMTTLSGLTNQIGNINITGNTTQSGNTTQVGNFNLTGNTNISGNTVMNGNLNVNGTTTLSGATNQVGNFNLTGNTSQSGNTTQIGNFNLTGNTNISGNTTQIGNLNVNGVTTLSGATNQIGGFNITGNTTQSGNTIQSGSVSITGNTNQLGNISILSANTGCTLSVNGTTCLTGPLNITGSTFMSGNFCMNNMNSTGQTGTNCFDTSLIPTGVTVTHQFQAEGGVFAHLGDLASGEPNSKGYLYMENNAVTTTLPGGSTTYIKMSGTTSTINEYLNLFTTGSTSNELVYNYPPATGSVVTYLKYNISYTARANQNGKQVTFALIRSPFPYSANTVVPAAMTNYMQGSSSDTPGNLTGIVVANHLDKFYLAISNSSAANTFGATVSDVTISLFT